VAWILFLPVCLVYAWNTLENHSDFWAHAAVGRWIVNHRQPPTHTLFLWTCHNPWIAHSWLSEAMMYIMVCRLSDDRAAIAGLLSATAIAFLAFALLWQLYRVSERTVCPAIILFSIGLCAASGRFLPRPEMASFVLLAVLLYVLVARQSSSKEPHPNPLLGKERETTSLPQPLSPPGKGEQRQTDASRADMRLAALLAAMFVLWTNLHGGMLAGLIVLWIAALSDLVQERASRRTVRFACTAALCTIATLINPYGWHYYSIYKAVSTVTFTHILEWKPVYLEPYVPASTAYSLAILLAATLFAWARCPLSVAPHPNPLLGKEREPADTPVTRRWSHLLWLLAFAAMTIQARRNVGFLALICVAVAAPYFQAWSARLNPAARASELAPKGRKRPARAKAQPEADAMRWVWPTATAIVYLVILVNGYEGMSSGPVRAVIPTIASGMCSFVKQNEISGRLFNDYDYGSYLEWRLGPRDHGLYVDGLNAYPDQVFSDYLDILNATPRGTQLLDQQRIDCVMGSAGTAAPVCRYVAASPEWALAYFGHDGPIWVRRLPQYRSLWEGVPVWQGSTPRDYVQYLHTAARDEAQ